METLSLNNYNIDLNKLLSEIELFSKLNLSVIDELSQHMDIVKISKHELLFKEDTQIDYIYFVYSGRLVAYKHQGEKIKVLGMILRGDSIGEMSLLTKHKTVANVKATRQSLLIRLPKLQIEKVINSHPSITRSLAEIILCRMEKLIKKNRHENILKHCINTIAIIGAGDHCITNQFSAMLNEALAKQNHIFEITPELLAKLSNDSNWEINASGYLSQLEAEYDYLIFNCGSACTAYSKYLVSNADTIILVGDASAKHNKSALEMHLNSIQEADVCTEKNLVLVHSSFDNPFNSTNLWLNNRNVSDVHHASFMNKFSLRSLARIITGNATTLVLGGGGACGYAHIGVLKAFNEYGIEIDAISGVSSGSIIAALYAVGLDSQQILAKLSKLIKEMKSNLFSVQMPVSSLFKPKHLEDVIHTLLGDVKIEDLQFKFFSLACNIASGEDAVFDRGPLSDAVVASNSLPGLCSPKIINNQPYVDGGVSNTLPGDVMKKRYGGTTIVVDVSKERGIELDLPDDKFPSSLHILLRLLNPFKKNYKIPYMHEIITRSVIIANKRKIEEVKQIADYVINPDLSDIGPMDHDRIEDIAAIGYKEALSQLNQFAALYKHRD